MSEKQMKVYRKALEEMELQRIESIEKLINLNARALACHCECLGMNAENAISVCDDRRPPYSDDNYLLVMKKWGLVNEKGESII